QITATVSEMLGLVQMSDFADRFPRQLSGGQQQRIALARCLAVEPKILLLDEPFGALDKNLRLDMQIEIKNLQRQCGITTILVTHDQEEALSMADRIAVVNKGQVEQLATPTEIYDRPATLFVNGFVGTTNLMGGTLSKKSAGTCQVSLDCGATMTCAVDTASESGERVVLSVRPENLRLAAGKQANTMPATVRAVMPLGPSTVYEAALSDGTAIKIVADRDQGADGYRPGDPVLIALASKTSCRVFAEAEAR
ncbi:MAG: ABC transporter ATP-binding protein, partial [Pseudomonadota bacterium]